MIQTKRKNFMRLYTPVHAQFERFCKARAYGVMDYKDLMQETIIVAFEKFERLEHEKVFLGYLFGTSTKILANANRKFHEDSMQESWENKQQVSNEAERNLEIEELYKALSTLSESRRETLILFEISGFSIREIAQMQKTSEAAVKQRLVRGRKELAAVLQPETVEIERV